MSIFKIDKRASYTDAHIAKALILLEKPTGREMLMKRLNLNEASARTLLRNLEKMNYVRPSSSGHVLTQKGMNFLAYIKSNVEGPKNVGKTDLSISNSTVAYLVRKKAGKIRIGIEQRDQAIRFGADGLTTIIYNKDFFIPGMTGWKIPSTVRSMFSVSNNDVILMASAPSEIIADLAALNSALILLE